VVGGGVSGYSRGGRGEGDRDEELRDMEGCIARKVRETWGREPKKKAEIRDDVEWRTSKKRGHQRNINMPFGRCADLKTENRMTSH
jgi:hypothetical protein